MSALWYLMRGTGAVTLVLLTLTVALGIANHQRWAPRRTPRFVVDNLHRTASLLVIVLLVIHITTAVVDKYVAINLIDAVVPFGGHYRPLWIGLGALAFDMLLALVITSLVRAQIGLRQWKAIHWLAYACWPVAFAHGLGNGTDVAHRGWMLWLALGCAAAVAAAVWARVTIPPRPAADSAPTAPVVPPRQATPRGALR